MSISWKNLLIILLFSWFIIFYFWNLGGFSLASWDEAWYGSISKNIIKSGNWLILNFNGAPYFDHPPFGFWLQAISQYLFGFGEFGVRLPSVIWSLGSLFFIYKLGKKWGGFLAGIIAMMILGTCIWFVLRTRSGNLDTILVGNMVGTLWWVTKTKEDNHFLPILFIFFLATLLTKSMIGIGIILLSLFWLFPLSWKLTKKLFKGFIFLVFILGSWAFLVKNISGVNPLVNMISVGARAGWSNLWGPEFVKNNLFYLHMGVEKWYYPMLLTLALSLVFLKNKEFKLLWLWVIIYSSFFLLNRKTEIWHLIPVYPALALILGLTINKLKFLRVFLFLLVIIIFIRQTSRLIGIIKGQDGNSVEAVFSKAAKKYQGSIYLDSDDIPIAAYYSEKPVIALKYAAPPFNKIDYLLDHGQPESLVLTTIGNLNNIDRPWQEIKKIGDKSLIILK
jgi:4-amino-4-deoxy-L-arabinose transferase-like glycosyltransferase